MFKQDEALLQLGAMALDHLFIQEYLPAARGDYVKVYIYGLYLSRNPRPDMNLNALAHELGMAPHEVEGALRYWERRRLIRRLSDSPPEYEFRSAAQLALSGDRGMEADPAFVAFSEDVYALFDGRRKVRPGEIALAWEWVQDMGLPQEIVMMLLSHMIDAGGISFSFKKAQEEAARMGAERVLTPEDAEAYFAHSRSVKEGVRAVLRELGQRRAPSQKELELYRKWVEQWGYTREAILAACDETAKGAPTFAYLDGILRGLRERAGSESTAPRTEGQLRRQLSGEQQEQASLRAFAQALGYKTATSLIANSFSGLCAQYGPELVLLVAEEAPQGRGALDAVSRQLEGFKKRGVTTVAEARAYFEEVHRLNRGLQPLLEHSGHRGVPTPGDRALYKKWMEWGFDEAMLLLAAEQARGADRKMPYIDKVLEAWRSEGISTPEQAAARKPAAPAGGRRVTAQQYAQRQYSESELESRTDDL